MVDENAKPDDWPSDERINTIGSNGNNGEHYESRIVMPLDLFEIVKRRCIDDKIRCRLETECEILHQEDNNANIKRTYVAGA